MMTDKPIISRPPNATEQLLKQKFAESIAAQSDLLDALAKQLVTLELAIPGIFATILSLVNGDKATVSPSFALYAAFISWLLALAATLIAVTPKNWKVNTNIMIQDPRSKSDEIGIEDFFCKSAAYKRTWLIVAILLFFLGVVFAVLTSF